MKMFDQAEHLRKKFSNDIKDTKTIAIISGKGGVGKSNTALNFSIELSKRGKKVLLFDLDVGMGNIDILLGKDSKYSIVHLFNEYRSIHDMIELGPKGLSYISGGTSLDHLLDLDEDKLNHFFEQYEYLVGKYDYIIFDLGASASYSIISFSLAADECFVITTPEPTSITDAYSMIKHIVNKQHDKEISVLMNRCNSTKEGRQTLRRFTEVIERFLDKKVRSLGMLPFDRTVTTAVMRQTPYVLLDKNAPVSKAMAEIVSNYLEQTNEINVLKRESFVHKLKRLITVR